MSRDDDVKKLRTDQDQLPGQLAAQTRLVKHDRRVYNAFNSLEIGFDAEAAIDFIKPSAAALGVPGESLGRMVGWCLSFGTVCVEAERQKQREEQRMQDENERTTEHTEETHTEKTETTEPAPAEGGGDSGDGGGGGEAPATQGDGEGGEE